MENDLLVCCETPMFLNLSGTQYVCRQCGATASVRTEYELQLSVKSIGPDLSTDLGRYQKIVEDVLQGMYEEMRAGAEFENPMLAAASRIALKWMEVKKPQAVPLFRLEAADVLAETVEAYLQALNDGVLHAEMGLRRALTAYQSTKQ